MNIHSAKYQGCFFTYSFDVASWIPAWKCLQSSFYDTACHMGGSPKPAAAQRNMALSPKSLLLLNI